MPVTSMGPTASASRIFAAAPTVQEVGTFGSTFIAGSLGHLQLPECTKALLQASWRESTHSQYDSVLRGWGSFCLARQTNPTSPSIEDVLVYLTSLYEQGLQYNTICTARSAFSGILHIPGVPILSDHPLIKRLLKGIYHTPPPTTQVYLHMGYHQSYRLPGVFRE